MTIKIKTGCFHTMNGSVPELCSVLGSGSGSGSVPVLQWWLSSVLDCRWSEKIMGLLPVVSVSGITTTRACSFSLCSVSHSPCSPCGSCSSLVSVASTELALSMVRSARLPSWCTSLRRWEKLWEVMTQTHACRFPYTNPHLYFYAHEDLQWLFRLGLFFVCFFRTNLT